MGKRIAIFIILVLSYILYIFVVYKPVQMEDFDLIRKGISLNSTLAISDRGDKSDTAMKRVPPPNPLIIETLRSYPFQQLINATVNNDRLGVDYLTEKLVADLIPYIILEPRVPINSSCVPPKFKAEWKCRKTSKKIGVLLQFAFEVDTLEIHFNELYDIVDKFFILESTRTHSRAYRKPLVWELVRTQARFSKFLPKVTHFVVDDADVALIRQRLLTSDEFADWGAENIQERLRWEKFLEWNNATNFFGEDDILGFGDTDEVPSRDVINLLKTCQMKNYPVDIGIWFPFGNIKTAFRTDFQVGNHPYTLGDPTYWTIRSIYKKAQAPSRRYPSRNRGLSPTYLLGGMHMSHYGYLPLQIIKKMTMTEASPEDMIEFIRLSETVNQTTAISFETKFAEVPKRYKHRLRTLDSLGSKMKAIAVLPWFYNCNRRRYPAWEGGHDTRLD